MQTASSKIWTLFDVSISITLQALPTYIRTYVRIDVLNNSKLIFETLKKSNILSTNINETHLK